MQRLRLFLWAIIHWRALAEGVPLAVQDIWVAMKDGKITEAERKKIVEDLDTILQLFDGAP